MKRYELTDEQWDKIKCYFEKKKGRPYQNLRATINGIIWIDWSNVARFTSSLRMLECGVQMFQQVARTGYL